LHFGHHCFKLSYFNSNVFHTVMFILDSWGANTYNQFVWPRRHVHPKATLTNKFYVSR